MKKQYSEQPYCLYADKNKDTAEIFRKYQSRAKVLS